MSRHADGLRAAMALVLVALATSCTLKQEAPSTGGALAPLKVVDVAYMDTTVKACTDFFEFANGAWLKTDTIPAAYSSSGVFKDMADRNELVVRSVLEDAEAARAALPDTSTQRKLGTFYATCMDSTAAESAGHRPAQAHPRGDRLHQRAAVAARHRGPSADERRQRAVQLLPVGERPRRGALHRRRRSWRPGVARSRLLPQPGGVRRLDAPGIRGPCRADVLACRRRLDRRGRRCQTRDGGGDRDGEGSAVPRGPPRPQGERPPDAAGRVREAHAERAVGVVLPRASASPRRSPR